MAGDARPVQLFRNMSAKIAAIPMVLTALVVFTGGTVWTIAYSFTNSKLVGLDQYERLWSSSRWLISIENLLIYGACSLFFSLIIGFMLAALLDQKIRFENTFRTIFLYPFALSFIVTGLVWQWVLNPDFGVQSVVRSLGITGFTFDPLYNADIVTYGILIAGLWQGTGLIMCLMLAGLRGIDEDIWKAARVDGIPMWKTYGTQRGIEWAQMDPNYLWYSPLGEPKRLITRGGAGANDAANSVTRVPGGHPGGLSGGFRHHLYRSSGADSFDAQRREAGSREPSA